MKQYKTQKQEMLEIWCYAVILIFLVLGAESFSELISQFLIQIF